MRGGFGSAASGGEVPRVRKSWEAGVGGKREVAERWRGRRAPDRPAAAQGPRQPQRRRPPSRGRCPGAGPAAPPAHTSRCAFPALHYPPDAETWHLQSCPGKAEEERAALAWGAAGALARGLRAADRAGGGADADAGAPLQLGPCPGEPGVLAGLAAACGRGPPAGVRARDASPSFPSGKSRATEGKGTVWGSPPSAASRRALGTQFLLA
ncbi:hypothetical protein VULLAG_LOCUS4035 [Vulpes lagopus]